MVGLGQGWNQERITVVGRNGRPPSLIPESDDSFGNVCMEMFVMKYTYLLSLLLVLLPSLQ